MTETPKLRSKRKTYPHTIIEDVHKALEELRTTAKPAAKELSAREAIAANAGLIRELLDEGFSAEQIVESLHGKGLSIAPLTLQKAVRQKKSKTPRGQTSQKQTKPPADTEPKKQPVAGPISDPSETTEKAAQQRKTDPGSFVTMPEEL